MLDILEYNIGKESWKPGKDFSFSSAVKVSTKLYLPWAEFLMWLVSQR